MKLFLPVFGVLAASASCCCFGSFDGLPTPDEPATVPIEPPPVPGAPPAPEVPGSAGVSGANGEPAGIPAPPAAPGSELGAYASEGPDAASTSGASTSAASTSGASTSSGASATAASGTHEGTLSSGDSHTVVLKTTGGATPPVGATGSLSKWVSKKMFGADVTMWLEIAKVTVTGVSGSSVNLRVDEVTFDATVNGKKVDPFEVGVKTQLAWSK